MKYFILMILAFPIFGYADGYYSGVNDYSDFSNILCKKSIMIMDKIDHSKSTSKTKILLVILELELDSVEQDLKHSLDINFDCLERLKKNGQDTKCCEENIYNYLERLSFIRAWKRDYFDQ